MYVYFQGIFVVFCLFIKRPIGGDITSKYSVKYQQWSNKFLKNLKTETKFL